MILEDRIMDVLGEPVKSPCGTDPDHPFKLDAPSPMVNSHFLQRGYDPGALGVPSK